MANTFCERTVSRPWTGAIAPLGKVRPGMTTTITTDAYPDSVFTGKVVRIAPQLEETSRQARIEIEVPNPESLLKPGMFISVRIAFETRENALVVPGSAMVRRNGLAGVFLVHKQESKAMFQAVETGISTGDFVEIASPTMSGLVVTLGHHLLEDGSTVRLPGDPAVAPGSGEGGAKQTAGKGPRQGGGKGQGKGKPNQGEPAPAAKEG